jgi:uncharacterized protein YndB with AHSA1/START domain
MDPGSYIEYDGRPAVRFERRYPHPVERVWDAVTRPEELARWFPSAVSFEPRIGGTIRFSGDPNVGESQGTMLAFDPPHRLAFSWGGDELHIELTSIDDTTCSFTLLNVLESRDAAARNAAGWSVCLAELTKTLSGVATEGPHGETAQPWRTHYEAYVAAGLPSGAAIPSKA